MEEKRIFCLIVGAGMCGVSLGDRLLNSGTLGLNEFVIIDKNRDFGGVWESNKYPGAACDIPSHAYVMRCALNADWTKKFADGKEIQQYYAKFANRRNLSKCTIFNSLVHEARWNNKTMLWEVIVEELDSGLKTKWIANTIFDNGGGFHRPKYANIPGAADFKGEQWHTGLWPVGKDLTGKRVALIGTGPSAAQVAPKIQPLVGKLYVYQRSCGHVLPRNNHTIPAWKQLLFRICYPLLWLYHVSWFVFFDRTKDMWMTGTKKNKEMHNACISFLEREVKDLILREKLRPRSEFGCKRVLFLDDWYSLFNNDNVELVTDKPIRITSGSIISKPPHALDETDRALEPVGAYLERVKEEPAEEVPREIDVLIWGTGFDMNDSGGHFNIYGEKGQLLSETWKDNPETYWSVSVTGFPNLFLTLGPNSTNYWSNITTVVEIQVNWHCKMLKHIKNMSRHTPYAAYPKVDVQQAFNDWLRANRGTPSFLEPTCATYHRTPSGATPMYNHFRIWNYYWKMRNPNLDEFVTYRL